MARFVAFLRGMNLGRRRITNPDLRHAFEDLGFENVTAFLASGNVVFDTDGGTPARIAKTIEAGLRAALEYDVPTFLRTAKQVRTIAAYKPFPKAAVARSKGKLQVALLERKPNEKTRKAALAMATPEDRVAIEGRELYWLPKGSILDAGIDLQAIEKTLGPVTIRTRRTVERIAARFLEA